MVAGSGFLVEIENTISSAEMITIGTTGIKPNTLYRLACVSNLNTTRSPGNDWGTGRGGWDSVLKMATATTAAATKTVEARAPHFVLPFQNKAAN